jgi:Alkylmercury lyase
MATGKYYLSLEKLHIHNIVSRLDEEERSLRFSLQDSILHAGRPVTVGDVIPFLDQRIDADRAAEILQSLIGKEIVVEEADGVAFAYPVSAWPTDHEVSLADGRRFYAMCAVDALGSAFNFGQDAAIVSKCHRCGKAVRIHVERNSIASAEPQTAHVLHVDLAKRSNWAGSS